MIGVLRAFRKQERVFEWSGVKRRSVGMGRAFRSPFLAFTGVLKNEALTKLAGSTTRP
jgi:hypothetical protein